MKESNKGYQTIDEYAGIPSHVDSTSTSYNKPGLPTPPAGWGKVITMTDSVDGDDEGPESRDEY